MRKKNMRPISRWTAIWFLALLTAGMPVPFGIAEGVTKSAAAANTLFAPLQQWRSAIIDGDAAALRELYSTNPPAEIEAPSGKISAEDDVAFWTGLKVRKLKLDVSQMDGSQDTSKEIVFQAEIRSSDPSDKRVLYLTEGQIWQHEGERWRLTVVKRTGPAHLQQPDSLDKQIYEAGTDPRSEIRHAEERAVSGDKRVLVVFGANWCYDCHVLDLAFHRPDLASVLASGYEVVHVDIGRGDKNQDLMQQYDVPMKKGIPAIAVLDANGKLLFSQKTGEFSNARALAPDDLLGFLNKWKPQAR
jgi:hypothetical protein